VSTFSINLQINSTFTDLAALHDFTSRLREIMAGFTAAPVVNVPASAPVLPTASVPSVPAPAPVAPIAEPVKAETKPKSRKTETKTDAAPVQADMGFAPIAEPASAPVAPVEAPAAPTPAPAPSPAAVAPSTPVGGTFEAKSMDDCRGRILAMMPKAGPTGAKRMMALFGEFGATKLGDIPADRLGELFAKLETALSPA